MAFRIHDSVVRGEIDNRVKRIVRGKIWVEGRAGMANDAGGRRGARTTSRRGHGRFHAEARRGHRAAGARTETPGRGIDKWQAGLEAVAAKQLLPETMVAEARKELFEQCREAVETMNVPKAHASMRYSGQCRRKAENIIGGARLCDPQRDRLRQALLKFRKSPRVPSSRFEAKRRRRGRCRRGGIPTRCRAASSLLAPCPTAVRKDKVPSVSSPAGRIWFR